MKFFLYNSSSHLNFITLLVVSISFICNSFVFGQIDVVSPQTQIAFFNAYSGAPSVDVLFGKTPLSFGVAYGSFGTPLYRSITTSGAVAVNVTFSSNSALVVSSYLVLDPGKDYTIVLQGRTDVASFIPGLLLFEDTSVNRCPISNTAARTRYCHVSPGAVVIDVAATLANTENYFYAAKSLAFGECSDELMITNGAYTFLALSSGSNTFTPLMNTGTTFLIQPNRVYNLYFTGVATQVATPFVFVTEVSQPCAAVQSFSPVPAPRVPTSSAGNNQFVPFVATDFNPDVAPFQPILKPTPQPTVPIIYGPRAPIRFAAASQLIPTTFIILVIIAFISLLI